MPAIVSTPRWGRMQHRSPRHDGTVYAVVVRRRPLVGWRVTIPGVGTTTAVMRHSADDAARKVIATLTGETDAQVVILPQHRGASLRGRRQRRRR